MRGATVVVRGLAHRPGRSLVVALLAAAAVGAAVLAPAYARAAQQSVLSDGLRNAPVTATGLAVAAAGTADAAPAAHNLTADVRATVDAALARRPALAGRFGPGLAGLDVDTTLTGRAEPLAARLAYRDGACAQLQITGDCPVDSGEVLVSARSAAEHGIVTGDRVTLSYPTAGGPRPRAFRVTGLYAPRDAGAAYWGPTGYFAAGSGGPDAATRIDALFAGVEDDVRAEPGAAVSLRLDYPLRAAAVRLDDGPALRDALGPLAGDLRAADLELDTALPAILDDAQADAGALARTVPVIAVPLLLLCWFVLFLLVAALVEDRAAELALARLRGLAPGRAARFALGETLLLIALAAPVGAGAALLLVDAVARLALAEGTRVELRWPVAAAAAVAVLATGLAAALAARRTLARPVLALLRRVPARRRWTAGAAEGVAVALAAVSLMAAVADPGAPLALLAAPLLAVVAGVGTARLLMAAARLRLRLARRRGRVPALLSAAQLARRPGGHRLVAVLTVAVALLAFAATAWDVASQARRRHAEQAVGAARVYAVSAAHPEALVAAVGRADPQGRSMAVVRAEEQYGDGRVALVGVQSAILPRVAVWPGPADVAALAAALHPGAPAPLVVAGQLHVRVRVAALSGARTRLAALVAAPGEPPAAVSLGVLGIGERELDAALPGCAGGCRLIGFGLTRAGGGSAPFAAELQLAAIRSTAGPVASPGWDRPDGWRTVPQRAPQARVDLTPGPVLGWRVSSTDPGDVVVEYRDAPDTLPAVLAGAAPADDPRATGFRFPGFSQAPQDFTVVGRVARLPRVGPAGLLVDLDYAVRAASRTAGLADSSQLRYEVWAAPDAPADLDRRLAETGVRVLRTDSIDGELARAARRAPALGFRLYLLAGAAAVLLALGAVLLVVAVAAPGRRAELAALRTAGVRVPLLRRAVLREHLALLGAPTVVGFAAGVAAALLMLPGTPLVTVGGPVGSLAYRPAWGALPVALAVCAAGVAAALFGVRRLLTAEDRAARRTRL
ncbi:MAG TPA: FtsX-like permease family protein [Pilimelia sp.]|nr:FtsX-like permease family protein [Pilimelia sp.]